MSIDKEKKSNRLLASRRYTHDSFTDAQESFTNVLDLQASEVYTQAHKIPSTNLPFSGSSQQGQIYTDGADNILKYYYRHKLTKSNLNNEVWFFLNPTGSVSGIGAQLIDSNQQTSFISPKYSDSTLANATAEDDTPGYLAKVFISTAANSASVSDSDVISVNDYTFDYKTGVLQFTDGTVDPSNSQYVYMSVNQYVGKTLADGIEITGDISGSASSTGSFGHLVVAGNITASGVVRADAFESVTGGETIDFKDSVSVTGNVNADNLTADSSSFSTRVTNLKTDSGSFSTRITNLVADSASFSTRITNLKTDSGSFSTRVTNLVADSASFSTRITVAEGELENTLISASEQLEEQISGSFTAPSASFSTRITNLVADSASFSSRITTAETELELTLISGSAQIATQISGAFDTVSSSLSSRLQIAEAELENTLISGSDQIATQISGAFTNGFEFSGTISGSSTSTGSFGRTIAKSGRYSDLQVTDDMTVTDDVGIGGVLTATGGTKLGNSFSDTHQITGSLTVSSNNLTIGGNGSISGSSTSTGSFDVLNIGSRRIQGNDGLILPSGNTSQRSGDASAGEIRFNVEQNTYEGYDGNNWGTLGGVVDVDQDTKISAENSAGADNDELIFFTAGTERLRIFSNGQISASGNITSVNIVEDSQSFSTRTTDLEVASASFSTRVTTAEQELENTIISASEQLSDQISGSFVAPSSSFSSRITTLEGSGEIQSLGTSDNVLFSSITGSDDALFQRDVVVLGKLTAQEIHTEIESASIIFTSGSTKFGDTSDDQHEFTGSILVKGDLTAENLTTDSSSVSARLTTEEINVDNLQTDSASFSSRITNFSTGNVELVSGSVSSTGSFGRVVTTDLLVSGESTLKNKVILKHDSSNAILEFRSTGGSRINDIHNFNPTQIYNSLFLSGNNGVIAQDGTYSGGNNRASIFSIGHIDGTLYHQFGNANQVAKQTGMGILDYDIISGSAQSTGSFGHVKIPDDGRLSIGNSNDLQLYHNGNHSFIKDGGSGNLILLTNAFQVKNATNNETMIQANQDGAVTLFHDNNQRLVTQKGGVNITGDITGSGNLKIDGNISSSGNIFGTNLLADSASFSTRVTDLKTNSGSFSLRNTNLEITSSALINNFDQVQSLGKTDSVVFSNITASNNTQLAGNVLMQSELNILGNITASGNVSASGNLFINGVSNFQGNVTLQNDLIVNNFNNLKVSSGRTISHQLSMDVTDAWELDDDGNYMPATEESFVIDPRFKVDAQGNIHLRKQGNELWTDDVHTYFE